MELWIPITIFAAFAQNLRFMLQKHLKTTRLSTGGATFSRFVFAAPLALLLAWVMIASGYREWPGVSPRFFLFAVVGGLGQITATMLVVISERVMVVAEAMVSAREAAMTMAMMKT